MFSNIGSSERNFRIISGVAFMVAGFVAPIPDVWHVASIDLGIAFILTSALGFCPFKAMVFRKAS